MPVLNSFTIPIPSLTRVHTLDQVSSAAKDLDSFLAEYISLVILTDFPGEPVPEALEDANNLCTGIFQKSLRRVLWIPKKDLLNAVKPDLESAIKAGFPNKMVKFDNVAALSLAPSSGKAAYLIYKNPALSPDPADKEKELIQFHMERAFNAASKTPK